MPTTVYGRESNVSVRPTAFGSDWSRFTQNCRVITTTGARSSSPWRNVRPDDRRHAQDVEVVVRDDRGADALRLIADARHRDRQSALSAASATEALLRAPQVLELRHRCGQPLLTAIGRLAPEPDQRVGVRVGQRAHEQAVDQREDRRVRTNAERQREHGHRREAGILEQHPAGVARVLSEGVHDADRLRLGLHPTTTPRSGERGPQRDPVAIREHHDGAPEKSRAGSPLGAQIFQ